MDDLFNALYGAPGTGMMGNMPGQISNNVMPGESYGVPDQMHMPGRVDSHTAEADEMQRAKGGGMAAEIMGMLGGGREKDPNDPFAGRAEKLAKLAGMFF